MERDQPYAGPLSEDVVLGIMRNTCPATLKLVFESREVDLQLLVKALRKNCSIVKLDLTCVLRPVKL